MSARAIVSSLSKAAASVVKDPLGSAGHALGAAKHAVAKGTALADSARGKGSVPASPATASPTGDEPVKAEPVKAEAAKKAAPKPAKKPATSKKSASSRKKATAKPAKPAARAAQAADKAIIEPTPPAEPPVDIVEQVLAEEAANERDGRATEPRGASRDEEHGEAAMQRAEIEELAEEAAEASPAGSLDIETPVGTTGADVGHNPDTAEADLQQPRTEQLLDPATAKAVASEAQTLSKAADTDKA